MTAKKLLAEYERFQPSHPIAGWRHGGANDVFDQLGVRIHKAEAGEHDNRQKQAAEAAANRIATLRAAAKRRPAITKQLFAVHCADKGLKPAAIRDKWKQSYPKEVIEDGNAGREDIKTALRRGREFLLANTTTVPEMASVLGLRFDA